jgi:soluble lytic murein transglycosylase-like protein
MLNETDMDEAPLIKPLATGRSRWIMVCVCVLGMFLFRAPEIQNPFPPVVKRSIAKPVAPPKIPPAVKKAEQRFASIINTAAVRYEVDPSLIRAIIMAESRYNPRAVSRRGAKGLMQLMPQTAKAMGIPDALNPTHNIHAGVRYFKQLLKRFGGDVRLALAAYNAGSKRVIQYQGIPPFKATQAYIKKVFRYYRYYKSTVDKA